MVDAIIADDRSRIEFLRTCLTRLGLCVPKDHHPVPSLSRLHLSATDPSVVLNLVRDWRDAGMVEAGDDGVDWIRGEQDHLRLTHVAQKPICPPLLSSFSSNEASDHKTPTDSVVSHDRLHECNASTQLVVHYNTPPDPSTTPDFNHATYFSRLQTNNPSNPWGSPLLYGRVMTSTSTLLDSNPTLLAHLPTGAVTVATTQLAARGRGSNVWISPAGALAFSVVVRHPVTDTASVVFVQYLAALAVVDAIASSHPHLPVRLKWPNDIYARRPGSTSSYPHAWAKIGGVLVTSSYAATASGIPAYMCVVGVGLNVCNRASSPSALCLADLHPGPWASETLLSDVLAAFQRLYARFRGIGFAADIRARYEEAWLHGGQVVMVDGSSDASPYSSSPSSDDDTAVGVGAGIRVRILGVDSKWGFLVAEELGPPPCRRWELRSDGNSFDFLRGLIRRKD